MNNIIRYKKFKRKMKDENEYLRGNNFINIRTLGLKLII